VEWDVKPYYLSWMTGSVAYTVFVWSHLRAPVELSTRYTTPDNGRDRQYECDHGNSVLSLWLSGETPAVHTEFEWLPAAPGFSPQLGRVICIRIISLL